MTQPREFGVVVQGQIGALAQGCQDFAPQMGHFTVELSVQNGRERGAGHEQIPIAGIANFDQEREVGRQGFLKLLAHRFTMALRPDPDDKTAIDLAKLEDGDDVGPVWQQAIPIDFQGLGLGGGMAQPHRGGAADQLEPAWNPGEQAGFKRGANRPQMTVAKKVQGHVFHVMLSGFSLGDQRVVIGPGCALPSSARRALSLERRHTRGRSRVVSCR